MAVRPRNHEGRIIITQPNPATTRLTASPFPKELQRNNSILQIASENPRKVDEAIVPEDETYSARLLMLRTGHYTSPVPLFPR